MPKVYINGIGCVSAQPTVDSVFLENAQVNSATNVLPLNKPRYSDYFSPIASRRMASGVKNGIVASTIALKEAGLEMPDAIITGTGMGCIEDSDKFLKAIIDNNEQFLTPTSFIQSTHNTVAAQIALGLQCKSYNFTYVNAAVSFESALLDASLQINASEANSILIGGVDEMTDYTASLFRLAGFIKPDSQSPYELLPATTTGAVFGEGASFFVLESRAMDQTYAEISAVDIINVLEPDEVRQRVENFLAEYGLAIGDIDAVVLGINGDSAFDHFYTPLMSADFAEIPQLYYKHLCGEFNTASAFGLYVAAKVMRLQQIPEIISVNSLRRQSYRNILLYNQYRGIDHSFILLKKC